MLSGGGSFSDSVGSSATYDAPAVSANTTVRVRCTATARGTGVNAAAGSAATSSDTESFTVTADLPAASAPNVTITPDISSLDENQTQIFTASISGGTYDTIDYFWTKTFGGGQLVPGSGNTATYTPGDVDQEQAIGIISRVTVTGTGILARADTSDVGIDAEIFSVFSCLRHYRRRKQEASDAVQDA